MSRRARTLSVTNPMVGDPGHAVHIHCQWLTKNSNQWNVTKHTEKLELGRGLPAMRDGLSLSNQFHVYCPTHGMFMIERKGAFPKWSPFSIGLVTTMKIHVKIGRNNYFVFHQPLYEWQVKTQSPRKSK